MHRRLFTEAKRQLYAASCMRSNAEIPFPESARIKELSAEDCMSLHVAKLSTSIKNMNSKSRKYKRETFSFLLRFLSVLGNTFSMKLESSTGRDQIGSQLPRQLFYNSYVPFMIWRNSRVCFTDFSSYPILLSNRFQQYNHHYMNIRQGMVHCIIDSKKNCRCTGCYLWYWNQISTVKWRSG